VGLRLSDSNIELLANAVAQDPAGAPRIIADRSILYPPDRLRVLGAAARQFRPDTVHVVTAWFRLFDVADLVADPPAAMSVLSNVADLLCGASPETVIPGSVARSLGGRFGTLRPYRPL
jgi:hypothetical protein